MASEKEITQVLAILAASYPRFTLTRETVAAYVKFLGDLPVDALTAAAQQCVSSCDFFPSVHELRAAVSDLRRKAQGVPTAYEAWEEVRTARPTYGRAVEENGQFFIERFEHQWTHPIVERVAKMLGWPKSFPGDEPGVDRAHFYKAYERTLADALEEAGRLPDVAAYIESAARTGMMRLGEGKNGR